MWGEFGLAGFGLENEKGLGVRRIGFSGRQWEVKQSSSPVGPGPNYFSDSAESVWVDGQDRLHLSITQQSGHWTCAEVVCLDKLGYGTYTFHVSSGLKGMHPNAVLGLFTYDLGAAEQHHREIDVEVARWGWPGNANTQYVVQPYYRDQNIHRFDLPFDYGRFSFEWTPQAVTFLTRADPDVRQEWWYVGDDLPSPGGEQLRLNLWIFELDKIKEPMKKWEVVVDKVEFAPFKGEW